MDGKVGEQINLENLSRRKYKQRWGEVLISDFYNNNKVDERLNETYCKKKQRPFEYSGHGESFFVSKEMFDSYIATCRCGNKNQGTHLLKCMKKGSRHPIGNIMEDDLETKQSANDPRTSDIKKLQQNFLKWERSTFYTSPKCYVPNQAKVGYRLFNSIFLG